MTTRFWTIPNVISLARLATIPFIVLAILQGAWTLAFWLFAVAGLSDGIDGFIARYFHQKSAFGAFLDPVADKAFTIAVFYALTVAGLVPVWLLVLIVARDVAILAGAGLMARRGAASEIRALPVSKLNTALLIGYAGWILASNAFGWSIPWINYGLIVGVVALTAVSAAAYVRLARRGLGDTGKGNIGRRDAVT